LFLYMVKSLPLEA